MEETYNRWDNSPFYEQLENIPGAGIGTTADKIGKVVLGTAVAGTVVHALATNIAKRKELKEAESFGEKNKNNIK